MPQDKDNPQKWLTPKQLAERLQISRRTVDKWAAAGRLPPAARYTKRCVRYRVKDIEAWELSQRPVYQDVTGRVHRRALKLSVR